MQYTFASVRYICSTVVWQFVIFVCYISLYFVVVLLIIVRTFVRRKSWGSTPSWSGKVGDRLQLSQGSTSTESGIDFWRVGSLFIESGSCRRWATVWLCSTRGLDASPSVRRGNLATSLLDAVANAEARRRLWVLRRYRAALGRCRRRRGTLCALTLSASSSLDVQPSLARRRSRWLFSRSSCPEDSLLDDSFREFYVVLINCRIFTLFSLLLLSVLFVA